MNTNSIEKTLRDSENCIEAETLQKLRKAREHSVTSAPWWRSSLVFRPLFATFAVVALIIALPLGNSPDRTSVDSSGELEQNLQTMIADPEFFLWLAQQGSLENS